ncbi:unnamed protein product, partial [Pelagomonas calceolata]
EILTLRLERDLSVSVAKVAARWRRKVRWRPGRRRHRLGVRRWRVIGPWLGDPGTADGAPPPRRRRHRPLVPRLEPELAAHRLDAKEQVRQLLAVSFDFRAVHHAPERVRPHAAPAQREAAPFEAQDVRRVVDDDFPELGALDTNAQRVDFGPGQLAARPRAGLAQIVRGAQLPPDLGARRRRRRIAVGHAGVEALICACDVCEALAITQLEQLEAAVVVEHEVPGGHCWRVVVIVLAGPRVQSTINSAAPAGGACAC